MAYVFGVDGTEQSIIEPQQSYKNLQQEYLDELDRWNQSVSQRLVDIRAWRTGELIAWRSACALKYSLLESISGKCLTLPSGFITQPFLRTICLCCSCQSKKT